MSVNQVGAVAGAVALAAILVYHVPSPKPALVPVPVVAATPAVISVPKPLPTVKQLRKHKIPANAKVDCSGVPGIARQYPLPQVMSYAKSYGLTDVQLGQLKGCLSK